NNIPVHDTLPSNGDQCLPKLSNSFIPSLVPQFFASSCTGREARNAAPDCELPFANRFKRGGACLFAHGCSSSDAVRATHRGIGRRSSEAALLVPPLRNSSLRALVPFALCRGGRHRRRILGVIPAGARTHAALERRAHHVRCEKVFAV